MIGILFMILNHSASQKRHSPALFFGFADRDRKTGPFLRVPHSSHHMLTCLVAVPISCFMQRLSGGSIAQSVMQHAAPKPLLCLLSQRRKSRPEAALKQGDATHEKALIMDRFPRLLL
jgi:hypothetical protein